MKALLDTVAFLWWINNDKRFSNRARQIVAGGENILLLSAASAWEIILKVQAGRMEAPEDPGQFVLRHMLENRLEILPIHLDHVLRVSTLPRHHRDPFDRLIIAQALVEDLPVVTSDPQFERYPVEVIW